MSVRSGIFQKYPYFWLFVLGLLWGANFLFMKVAGKALPATQIVWLRLAFGTAALTPFLLGVVRAIRKDARLLFHVCAMSLAANVVTFHCFMEGTKRLDSGIAGVISGTIPIMTALLAALVLPEERFGRGKILGLVLSFAGIVVIMAPWKGVTGSVMVGAAYMLLGALGYGVAFVYARRFLALRGMSPLGLAALQMLAATILYSPLTQWNGLERLTEDTTVLVSVGLGLGVLGSGAAYVIYYGLIQAIGAVAASAVTYLPPLVAMALGVLFLGEPLRADQVVGAVLVLGGIFVLRQSSASTAREAKRG